jgi:hypothetical protein
MPEKCCPDIITITELQYHALLIKDVIKMWIDKECKKFQLWHVETLYVKVFCIYRMQLTTIHRITTLP